jgi:hypothetical protein
MRERFSFEIVTRGRAYSLLGVAKSTRYRIVHARNIKQTVAPQPFPSPIQPMEW